MTQVAPGGDPTCCLRRDLERLPPAGARLGLCLAFCLHCCSAWGTCCLVRVQLALQQVQHQLELLQVQQIIGARNATAMDLTAACSGFVLGVVTAAQFIRTGMCRNILVIGADALSRYVDWRDRCEPSLRLAPAADRRLFTGLCQALMTHLLSALVPVAEQATLQ